MKYIITIICCIALSACHYVPRSIKPKPFGMQKEAPADAPESYRKGWVDGCDSGLAGFGNMVYKSFYHFSYDKELIKDPLYAKAWKDRYAHCRAMVNRVLADGLWFDSRTGTDQNRYVGIFQAGQQMRDTPEVDKGKIMPEWWYGMDLPMMGQWGWGANVKSTEGTLFLGKESPSHFEHFLGHDSDVLFNFLSTPNQNFNKLHTGLGDSDIIGKFLGR